MKTSLVLLIVSIASCYTIYAQGKSAEEKKGDKYAFVYLYNQAIESYTKADDLSMEGKRKLAESYHEIGENVLSAETYKTVVSSSTGIISEDYYNYAMALKTIGNYGDAAQWMDKFAETNPNDLRSKSYVTNKGNLSSMQISNGDNRADRMSFNTDAQEFGASYYKNGIVFSSSKTPSSFLKRKNNMNGKPFLDMYVAEINNGQLEAPKQFDRSLNGNLHDGPASFSNNGTFVAFTRNNYKDKSKDKIVELQIYFSTFTDGKWSQEEAFMFNGADYSVGHPCLTKDGKTMYFISNMPGGYGKADIYKTTRNAQNQWTTPENLGATINTEDDELFPFFEEKNQVLFFASNGHFGLGGQDIFKSQVVTNGYGKVVNLKAPINTQFDDYSMIVDENMDKGYLSSNRKDNNDDIYTVNFKPVSDTEEQPEVVALVTKEPVIENSTKEIIEEEETPKIIKTPIKEKVKKTVVFTPIYFDLDEYAIRSDARAGLDKIVATMNENPNMIVVLSSYADSRHTEKYNQALSEKRATESLFYIKKRITKPGRITGKGYGETDLVNGCTDNGNMESTCSEVEHQKNRRTEFTVISNSEVGAVE